MSSSHSQPNILGEGPAIARSLTFRLRVDASPGNVLAAFAERIPAAWITLGIGEPVALLSESAIGGLRTFPGLSGAGCASPSTQGALWILLRGDDHTELYKREGAVRAALSGSFAIEDARSLFHYDGGRALSGFEDGTENPTGQKAERTAIVTGAGALDGSSFVAVQRWIHDLNRFAAFAPEDADAVIGRRLKTNEELEDAPPSAHVKRTAQESFDPETFLLRRSMPWSDGAEHGLEFIAFAASLDNFERMLRRMLGHDDGIVDALFRFSRPVTGGYYWCPPVRDGKIDLRALDLPE